MKRSVLLAFIFLGVVSPILGCSRSVPASEGVSPAVEKAPPATPAQAADRVEVYYFHGDRRCPTCRGIQRTVEETLQEKFAAETGSGRVVYSEVNTDQPENKHFVKEFDLSFSTMVIVQVKDNKTLHWENCQSVWDYAHEHEKLKEYVTERVTHYLGGLEKQ